MPESERIPASRGERIEIEFAGEPVDAYEGETVAAALLAAHVKGFSRTREGEDRLPLCNMGTCFDCAVTVDGTPLVRACLTDVWAGMKIEPHEAS